MMHRFLTAILLLVALTCTPARSADDAALRRQAADALRKATDFFCQKVSTEGGYLWQYSEDLSNREGEGQATDTQVWVQPPGTPSVGMALLEVYRNTGDTHYLEAAKRAGYCLVRGQLRSGGWDYRIEFDPDRRPSNAYRVDPPVRGKSQRNATTLDDNTTQSALRLLMELDRTLEFKDAKIHGAAEYALDCLLKAQYPNGAWPQRYEEYPDPAKFPVKRASYPDSWSRTFPNVKYSTFYTFNDNALSDVVDVMFLAEEVYGQRRYGAAAEKAGDYLLLAQMPEPQPAWAQQYDADMHPAWARKFEPPSVTGGESQGVMRTLMQVYTKTGNKKYLEPIPRAIEYLRRSQLADGRLARFYELKTNRPLYFTKDYQLTYSDADMPTHYSFQGSSGVESLQRAYEKLLAADPKSLGRPTERAASRSKPPASRVQQVIASLDDQGRWVEDGALRYQPEGDTTRRIIDCQTFIRNVVLLSQYVGGRE